MAKSKSGVSPKEREKTLRDHGFEPLRGGKGSHEIWENKDLKFLAQTQKIGDPPANLRANPAQKPWEITVPHDPASGTWNSIKKYATWCKNTVETAKAGSEHDNRRINFANQFNGAAGRRPARDDMRNTAAPSATGPKSNNNSQPKL